MRELISEKQIITIIPQNFKDANKGQVIETTKVFFRMQLKYLPNGLFPSHICDFYSYTDNGYLYFESYIQKVEENVVSIAMPIKHRFLQRRKYTRIPFIQEVEMSNGDNNCRARTLDLSAGGMKLTTETPLGIDLEYDVVIKLSEEQEIKCKYLVIRVEKGNNDKYYVSGKFSRMNNIDKMTLIQYCMKKNIENKTK